MQGTSRAALEAESDRLLARAREAVRSGDAAAFGPMADELFAVVDVLDRQPSLRRALADPALPADRKADVVAMVLGGKVGAPTIEVLQGLARRRWSEPRDLVDAVETLAGQAAFTVAEAEQRLDEVEDELFRFGRIVDGEPRLRAALTDPGLPADRKSDLVRALLEGKVVATTVQLATYAVNHPRGRTLERSLDRFARLAAARRERLLARVTSAVPLDEDQQQRLAQALERIYGAGVQLQLEVDPGLGGGVVVRVGDEVIDGSIRHRIQDVRQRFAS